MAKSTRTAAKRPARAQQAAATKRAKPAPARRKTAPAAKRKTAPTTRRKTATAAAARKIVARQQPETLRLRSIAPTLTVDDIDRSLAWYRDVLGFVAGERWESEGKLQGIELRAGSCTWYLTQDDFAKGRDRQKGIGFRFYCETTQDVDALARRIKAAGGTLTQEPMDQPWGGRSLAVADPDGFQISIVQQRGA